MFTIENAQLVLKDKYGNVARIQNLGPDDLTKIHNAIADIGKLVDPVSHLPIKATTTTVGVVQLADAEAIAAGTTGRVVDAKQLQDAVMGVSPANCVTNVAAGSTANKIKVTKDGYTTTIEIDNVEHASFANQSTHAANADNATHAVNADAATTAGYADNATHAVNADNATHAVNADAATTAGYADNATHAANADNATHAVNADAATTAGYADNATHAVNADNGVDSSGVDNTGGGWIRFKNGVQICWASGEFQQTETYQKAFIIAPRLLCTAAEKRSMPQELVVNFYMKSATSFACRVWNVNAEDWETEGNFDWIAIGRWK